MERWLKRPGARSGEGLCSHASLDCLLNRIYFLSLIGLFCTCGLTHMLPRFPVTIDFPGIYS